MTDNKDNDDDYDAYKNYFEGASKKVSHFTYLEIMAKILSIIPIVPVPDYTKPIVYYRGTKKLENMNSEDLASFYVEHKQEIDLCSFLFGPKKIKK